MKSIDSLCDLGEPFAHSAFKSFFTATVAKEYKDKSRYA
jgi:hypothetical protein